MATKQRHRVFTDEQWARIEPLLPSNVGKRARPFESNRRIVEGMVDRCRSGIAWRDLHREYFGTWTVYSLMLMLLATSRTHPRGTQCPKLQNRMIAIDAIITVGEIVVRRPRPNEFTVHVWNLTRAVGGSDDLDPVVATAALDGYAPNVPADDRAGAFGQAAGWVNNAAVFCDASLDTADPDEVIDLITTNLALAVAGCTFAVRRFLAAGTDGAIANARLSIVLLKVVFRLQVRSFSAVGKDSILGSSGVATLMS